MMDHKTVEDYVLSMPGAVLDYPFGEGVAVYKLPTAQNSYFTAEVEGVQGDSEQHRESYDKYGERVAELATQQSATSTGRVSGSARKQDSAIRGEGKMFALIAESTDPLRISLKCDPQLAVLLREKYETVLGGYHLNKKHWNTILLTGQLPWEEVQGLILHSYQLVAEIKGHVPTVD